MVVTMPDGSTRTDKAVIIRPQSLKGQTKVAIRSHNYALVQEKRHNAKLLKGMASSIYNKLAKVGWWRREERERDNLIKAEGYLSWSEVTKESERNAFISQAHDNATRWKKNHKLWPLFRQYNDYIDGASKLDGEAKVLISNLGSPNLLKTTLVVTR